jgi:hypothetical protein
MRRRAEDVARGRLKMKYMLLCYDDEAAWEKVGKEALQQAMQEAVRLTHELHAKGQYLMAAPLQPGAMATSVQVRGVKRLITDGPFAETAEVLGGFYLIDVESEEQALEIAARHPGARVGTVEVRRVLEVAGLPRNQVMLDVEAR